MKKLIVASFAATMMSLAGITFAAPSSAAAESSPNAGQIMVKFRDNSAASGVLRQHGLSEGPDIGSTGARTIKVPAGREAQFLDALSRNPAVEYAEPDVLVTATSDDEFFPRQYALQNHKQSFTNTLGDMTVLPGDEDADVDAVEAWGVATGATARSRIKVAIIDSGVAIDHDDISPQVVARANFSDKEIRPGHPEDYDVYGHGTHVAGIVAAIADNSIGVAGVCPDCSIMDVKVLNDAGTGSSSDIAKGIDWAVANGAQVINMSLGQRVSSRTLEAAVNNAWKRGVVIVAAAGNAGTQAKIYPGAYSNVISVAATDNNDAKAPFSTFGRWVDVAAPGVNVYSTFPNHGFVLQNHDPRRSPGYDVASGTSMASPIVAAVAALVWSKDATADNETVRSQVENTADEIHGTGTYWTHGRVNACRAVDAEGCAPD